MYIIVYLHIVSYLIFVGTFFHLPACFAPRFSLHPRGRTRAFDGRKGNEGNLDVVSHGMIWFIMALYGFTWFYIMTYMVYIHYKYL